MKQFTLPKQERLYLRESIGELFAKGRSFTVFPYRVMYLVKSDKSASIPSAEKQARCAIMAVAPKKKFKHAVDRNHVKRLTREAYRLQKLPLIALLEEKGLTLEAAFLYLDNKFLTFDETYRILGRILGRLQKSITSDSFATADSETNKTGK